MKSLMSVVCGICLLVLLVPFSVKMASSPGKNVEVPDLVLFNGKIITVDPQFRVVSAVAIKDGKIVSHSTYYDSLSLLQQLGVIPQG